MRISSLCLLLAAGALLLAPAGCGGEGTTAAGGAEPEGTFAYENPLLTAKPGDWAEYRRIGSLTERLTVLSTDPATHALKLERQTRDTEVNALRGNPTVTIPPNQFLFGFAGAGAIVGKVGHDRIELLGRTFEALYVETVGRFQGHIRSWYSNDVPVYGLLLQERVEKDRVDVIYELIDYSGR